MKRFGIALTISLGILGIAFLALRLSGKVGYYVIPTTANEPNMKMGSRFFTTTLMKPERLDLICFMASTRGSNERDIYVSRLCAIAGDNVEIRDGVLFVNGQKTDRSIKLCKEFLVPKKYLPLIKKADPQTYENIWDAAADTAHVFATQEFIIANHILAMQMIYPVSYTDDFMQQRWGKNWNMDQFGPVVVPAHCYFVLGDNRHNSIDSRYRGFIPERDYRSTVIKKAAN